MEQEQQKPTVMLIAFYNTKALGVRYLEGALERAGYEVVTVFYKTFNSVHPQETTDGELRLLCKRAAEVKPLMIGLSVMSSMYLDTVYRVLDAVTPIAPVVCGGAYATMFPEVLLKKGARFVIRGDGERALYRLAEALAQDGVWRDIPSLCYGCEGGAVINPIGDVSADLDEYGIPVVKSRHACLIEHGRLTEGDPQLKARSYEVVASRGCPFTCSYCCCVNLGRLLPPEIPRVRTRSVQSVIAELTIAKKECPNLIFIHFYDEIFPNLPGWVETFCAEYQEKIGLPFTIWSHPKMADRAVLQALVAVGLTEVVTGIQSGSERLRREVFHRLKHSRRFFAPRTPFGRAAYFGRAMTSCYGIPLSALRTFDRPLRW